MAKWKSTIVNAGLLIGAGVLALQLRGVTRVNATAGAWVSPDVGRRIDALVSEPGARPIPFSDVGGQGCRYVIVVSSTCGASATALKDWARQATGGTKLPAGWSAVFVSDDDSAATAAVLPAGLTLPTYYAVHGDSLADALRLRAYPVHVILDGNGAVVYADVGAPIPESQTLGTDCHIDSSKRAAASTKVALR